MIPNLPVLNRGVYRSGLTKSFYDPRALLTKVFAPDFSKLEEAEFLLHSFEYNATVVHEQVHWLQHHGTSFGCFLSALRLSQNCTTQRWLREESSVRVEDLLDQRARLSTPILRIDSQTQFPIFEQDQEMDTFRRIWFEHQWVYTVFEDSRIAEQLVRPPGSMFGDVIGDTILALWDHDVSSSSSNTSLESALEAQQWFSMNQSDIFFMSMFGMRLTSKILMEAPAIISEFHLLSDSSWLSLLGEAGQTTVLTNRIRKVINSDYGIPIRCILKVLNLGLENLRAILPTVNLLCFIALNPPLPPYVMAPPIGSPSWTWRDIYPPSRFSRLAHCVSKIGLLKASSDHNTIAKYIDDICDVCELPHTVRTNYPERLNSKDDSHILWGEEALSSEFFKLSDHSKLNHRDYIFGVQARLMNYRLSGLPLLVDFGGCLSGDLATQYFDDIVDFRDVPFVKCPLVWTEDNRLSFSSSKEFGNWLVISVLVDYVLFDVVVGTGKYDLNAFPEEVRDHQKTYGLLERSILQGLAKTKNL
jgi:hypothetical protein